MKTTLHILFLSCLCTLATAQVREREVISTAGGISTSGLVSYTIGEAVIDMGTSATGVTLTQGFEQPTLLELARSNKFNFKLDTFATSCNATTDGSAFITPYNLTGAYKVLWLNENTKDTVYDLSPGTYSVTVTAYGADTTIISKKFTIAQGEGECLLKPLNGMTPNGDYTNDVFYIRGIELYPENSVAIYNRWGGLEWEGNNYDNTTVVFKGINGRGGEVPSGTYFYHLKFIQHSGKAAQIKNWLELTR